MAVAPAPTGTTPRGTSKPRGVSARALEVGKRFLTLRESSIIVVTLITFVYFATSTSNFVTGGTFKALLPYFTPAAIMAAGVVFVMILGEIDLSIGGTYLFTPFMFHIFHHAGLGLYPAMILAIVVALAIGAVNGFFIAYVGIASFVATLGMGFLLDGLTLVVSHSTPISTPGTQVAKTTSFAQVFGAGTYSELFWAIVVVVVLQVALSFTRWGLYTVSTGGNRLGADEAGVRTRRIMMRNFILVAGLAGFTGILEAVRVTTATPDPSGSNVFQLQVIAAAIIGGTLMTGGEGTVVGAMIGALFLGILNQGLTIKGVSASYLDLYLGIAILIAMTLNVAVRRLRTGSGRG